MIDELTRYSLKIESISDGYADLSPHDQAIIDQQAKILMDFMNKHGEKWDMRIARYALLDIKYNKAFAELLNMAEE